jgi:uncharacterized membrane protein YsdA (DUF1294 family)
VRNPDAIALLWFGSWSLATFVAFGWDKWRAARSVTRVPEATLVLLGALGGWPGGLLGMNCFRHKTAKWSFQLKYALGLIPFGIEVWLWWHWR